MKTSSKLWTKDFTIITLGSIVSMFGNNLSSFAMSLLVLDYTASTSLYAIYLTFFTLPQVIMPILSGAFLDRYSRKKAIYMLDYCSCAVLAISALIFKTGHFNYPVLLLFAFIVGSINSCYLVAYQSFYPLLIPKGYYSKAYSVGTFVSTLAQLLAPISAFLYNHTGIVPLLLVNSICFFLAATMETRIEQKEDYIETAGKKAFSMFANIIEGFRYLYNEKGLLAIAIFFTSDALAGGISQVVLLPFFKGAYANGAYIYAIITGMITIGRTLGSAWWYRHQIDAEKKYAVTLFVYIVTSLIEAVYLHIPIPITLVLCFFRGILGTTSYNIRISSTQNYVPDERKGRFNGAFNMLSTLGSLAGQMVAALLTLHFSGRAVLTVYMLFNALFAVIIIGGNKEEVSKIYNHQQ